MGEKKCPYSFPENSLPKVGEGCRRGTPEPLLCSEATEKAGKGLRIGARLPPQSQAWRSRESGYEGIWREGWGIWLLPWNLGGWGGEKWQLQNLRDASHGSKAFGASLESDFIICVCTGCGRRLSGVQLISLLGHKGVETACWAHLLRWRDNTQSESLTAAACIDRVLVSPEAYSWMGGEDAVSPSLGRDAHGGTPPERLRLSSPSY